jgi:hypothetical protein
VTATDTPVLTQAYAAVFAHRLAETVPGTPDHMAEWNAYTLATAVAAGEIALHPSAETLDTDYTRRLAEAMGEVGVPGIVVPLHWDVAAWRRHARIMTASLHVREGGDPGGWHGVLGGLLAGRITIRDRRDPARLTAFVLLG